MAFCKRNDWLILPCAKIGGILAAQPKPEVSAQSSHQAFLRQFVAAAIERTHHVVRYDPAYVRIAYPGGDVPSTTGVCTDEVIRAYRAVGIDLQKEVHEDMAVNFGLYPSRGRWLRKAPDSHIDHRRGPPPVGFFSPQGGSPPHTKPWGR